MNKMVASLLLVSGLCAHAAEIGATNLVVFPLEVDPKSVSLAVGDARFSNVTFNYINKTPEQVRAIYRRHQAVDIVKDGVIVAKAASCSGYKGRHAPDGTLVFSGLVLIFDDLEQARIAERVLTREDKKPE